MASQRTEENIQPVDLSFLPIFWLSQPALIFSYLFNLVFSASSRESKKEVGDGKLGAQSATSAAQTGWTA